MPSGGAGTQTFADLYKILYMPSGLGKWVSGRVLEKMGPGVYPKLVMVPAPVRPRPLPEGLWRASGGWPVSLKAFSTSMKSLSMGFRRACSASARDYEVAPSPIECSWCACPLNRQGGLRRVPGFCAIFEDKESSWGLEQNSLCCQGIPECPEAQRVPACHGGCGRGPGRTVFHSALIHPPHPHPRRGQRGAGFLLGAGVLPRTENTVVREEGRKKKSKQNPSLFLLQSSQPCREERFNQVSENRVQVPG